MSAPPLDAFLVRAKEALHSARTNKGQATLVLGKEEPDLDSIASAIVFAYFRTASPPQDAWSPLYIPVLNERRSDLLHQALLMRVLPHASIALEHLIAVDDMVMRGTQSGLQEDLTRFFFVDHNLTLGREKQNYSHKVIGCIDHNPDENYVPHNTEPEPRIITQAGSCTSLVVEYSRRSWESLVFDGHGSEASLAKLALAAILVDTKNLESGVTNADVSAVEFLLSRINFSTGGQDFDRTSYYYEIIGEKRPETRLWVQYGPEPPPEPISVPPPAEAVYVETRPETPLQVVEEPIVEPQVMPPVEPVAEVQPQEVFVPEPTPERTEPVQTEAVFVEPIPAAQVQGDKYDKYIVEPVSEREPSIEEEAVVEPEPIVKAEPVFVAEAVLEPEPIVELEPVVEPQPILEEQPTTLSAPAPATYQRVFLADVLGHDFELGYEGGGAIGISFTPMGLAEMVFHAERDLIERAIREAEGGAHGEEIATDRVMSGTPFTAAVRQFALARGLSVYAIRTNIKKGNELFVWVSKPSMGYYVPRLVQNRAKELGLERWGRDEDKITGGMNDGMTGAFWMRNDPGREGVKKAVMEGTTYIFFGNGST